MKVSSLGSILICLSSLASAAPRNVVGRGELAPPLNDTSNAGCSNGVFVELPTGNKRVKPINKCKPMPSHTCARDALVALALWRDVCTVVNKLDAQCWLRAPSIERCCGEWVHVDDEHWKDAGTYHSREEEKIIHDEKTDQPIKVFNGPEMRKGSGKNAMRLAIKPGWADYNTNVRTCRLWRPQNDDSYTAIMQNLADYGLADVNEKGELHSATGDLIGYMP
jgi:hypothetical protein